ncbi:HmuY family protein [Sphingobacterium cavernae]|uniref:HmuY family protein n=1 Tax=Sphingobacterium cavernae TaxID=2592657 RepID=UPI0012300246
MYVDLSSDIQTPITRDSWDLGFYSGSDFRVILNNSVSAAATVTAKNSLTEVGSGYTKFDLSDQPRSARCRTF